MTLSNVANSVKTFVDGNNVVWYSNPDYNIQIGSDYTVKSHTGRLLKPYRNQYKIDKSNPVTSSSISGLMCAMFGFPMGKGNKSYIIDENLPLSPENVGVGKRNLNQSLKDVLSNSFIKKDGIVTSTKRLSMSNPIKTTKMENTYYITEDLMRFTNQDMAIAHQIKVDAAKEIANEVLENLGGYAFAEKMYLKFVNRGNYVNFIDVLNNNEGIMTEVKETTRIKVNPSSEIGFLSEMVDNIELNTIDIDIVLQLMDTIKSNVTKLKTIVG